MKKLSLLFGEHVPKFEAALIEFNPVFPTLIILKTSLPKGQLELIQLPKLVIKTSNSWWHYLICRIFSAPLSLNTQKNSEKKKKNSETCISSSCFAGKIYKLPFVWDSVVIQS